MRSEALGRPAEAEPPSRPFLWPSGVLDALEQGVVALDRERRVIYNNRRIEEFLGVEPGTLIGTPGSRLFPGADARWLKGASREAREFRLEPEGRELTLKAESLPIRDEDGEAVGSVVFAEAISESEDGEFQKKIDRLVSLGELSAYVAHEIRNPLTGIRTTVQFVGSKLKPNDPRREDLEDVIKELDRIEQIITGLLMFARPPAARPQPCDVHQVLDKTLDFLELQLNDAQVTLFKNYGENQPLGDWFVGIDTYDANIADQFDMQVLVKKAPGVPQAAVMPESSTLDTKSLPLALRSSPIPRARWGWSAWPPSRACHRR